VGVWYRSNEYCTGLVHAWAGGTRIIRSGKGWECSVTNDPLSIICRKATRLVSPWHATRLDSKFAVWEISSFSFFFVRVTAVDDGKHEAAVKLKALCRRVGRRMSRQGPGRSPSMGLTHLNAARPQEKSSGVPHCGSSKILSDRRFTPACNTSALAFFRVPRILEKEEYRLQT
jgi:hypothetical protein